MVKSSKNKDYEGLEGKVLDETKHTFKVEADKTITILKKDSVFLIDSDVVEGNKIEKRPEDRVKIKG